MRMKDTIEIYVINNHVYSSTPDTSKTSNTRSLINGNNNNNNNNNLITAKQTAASLRDDVSDKSSKIAPLNTRKQQTINTSYPNLFDPSKHVSRISDRGLTRSVPALSTGLHYYQHFIYESNFFSTFRNHCLSKRFSFNFN